MASAVKVNTESVAEPTTAPYRKKFKTSELPLNLVQRSSIDGLVTTIKKKGEFDSIRKAVWTQYIEGDEKSKITAALHDLAESEIEREPSLLSRERGKAATLIEGAVDRSSIYKDIEATLDELIAKYLGNVDLVARRIRRQEVGGEAAAEEETCGKKSDEQYAGEVAVKRIAREKIRKVEEAKKRREKEKERLREEEKQKRLELDNLRKADERRKEEEARLERRKQERAARKEVAERIERERESARREENSKRDAEELELEKQRQSLRVKNERYRTREKDNTGNRPLDDKYTSSDADSFAQPLSSGYRAKKAFSSLISRPEIDENELEAAALEMLLQEGRDLAQKSLPNLETERSVSLEPPLRKGPLSRTKPLESLSCKVRDASRSHSAQEPSVPRGKSDASARRDNHNRKSRSISRDRSSRSYHQRTNRSRSRSLSPRKGSHQDLSRRAFNDEDKEIWKRKEALKREEQAEIYKRNFRCRQESNCSRSRSRDIEETDRHFLRDNELNRSPRRRSISESASRRSKNHRSSSPKFRKHQNEEQNRHPRAKSPVEIDRYVPPTSSRARSRVGHSRRHDNRDREEDGLKDRDRDRCRDQDRYRERDKDRNKDRDQNKDQDDDNYRPRDCDRVKDKEKGRNRDEGRTKDRNQGKERDRDYEEDRDRDPGHARTRVGDRDRMRGHNKDHERDRNRDHDRDRNRDHERDRGRDRRDRGKERDYLRNERDEKPRWVEIDRYTPAGSAPKSEDESRRKRI